MKFNNIFKQTLFASSVVISTAMFSGCSNDDEAATAGSSSVRIIHASADAPPVNIKLDSTTAVSNLDYADSTGFVSITSGIRDVAVEAIVPGGNLDVITVDDFNFGENQRYTVVAIDDTANIVEFIAEESATTPAIDEVAISVLHAATSAGNVDVYVTAPGVDLNSVSADFTFDFKGQVDAGALPAGSYQVRVTGNGSKTAVYDSGPLDLSGFAGQKLLLLAVNTVNSTTKATSPVKIMAYTDSAQLELLDTLTNTGARVVHLSPDAGTAAGGPVEVYASSSALPASPALLIPSFSYTETVPGTDSFAGVPGGDYIFDVAAAGTGIGSSVYTSPSLSLSAGAEYTVIAAGYVLTTPALGLLASQDNNRSVVTQASVKVVHGAPMAGAVDVFVTAAGVFTTADVENGNAGAPLLDDFTFGEITDYVNVAPGNYDIRVIAGGSTAINVENFNLAAGSVSTVIAREPVDSGTPSDFNVVVLTN